MKAKDPSTRLVESISMDVKDWWPKHIVESAWLEHTPFAAWLISALQPRIMVELGTHRAVSYMAFCQASSKLSVPAKCFAVDTWKGDDHAGKYSESIFRDVQDLNQPYENFSTLVRSKFDEALSQFQDGSIDLLHIDGFHTYEAVSHDFNSWLPKMSQRGVVLFHDTAVHKKDFGVWRLWSELSEQHPHFHFSHGFGLGVLSVGANPCPLIQCLCALVSDQKNMKRSNLSSPFVEETSP